MKKWKGIIKEMKNKKIRKIVFDLNREKIISIAYESDVYENISLENSVDIPLMISGSNGIYIFIPYCEEESLNKVINIIRTKYGLYNCDIFIYLLNETECFLLDKDGKKLILLEDLYISFENMYLNTQLPYIDYTNLELGKYENLLKSKEELEDMIEECEVEYTGDVSYVKPIVSKFTVDRIAKINKEKQQCLKYIDENTREDEEGTVYVQKHESYKYIGLIKGKKWYRCSDENPNKIFFITLLGGWFGLHKFREGKIKTGLFYLLTCGGCGVFYVMDLIDMITGSRCYDEVTYEEKDGKLERNKEKVYYQKLSNPMIALLLTPIALIISVVILNTLYKAAFDLIMQLLMSLSTRNLSSENAEETMNMLNNLINY